MANNGYEDDYDLDFYQNAIQVRETLLANRSPSANESQAFQKAAADEELAASEEFYQKNGNGNMPLPSRYNYHRVSDVDNIQLGKFRAKHQYFAGVDTATRVKDLNSVLDPEPGYDEDEESGIFADLFDDLMQDTAERVAKGVRFQQSVERTGRGAVWKMYQMLHRTGLMAGEAAASLLTPEELAMDEEKAKAFWEAKDIQDVAGLPESIQPQGNVEKMAQDMLAYLAPYSAVAKSIGMFNAIKQGRYVGAVARDAIASAILAQGYDPKEGTLSTVLRELGFGEDILAYTDSKASYENDGRWAARLAMTMEEVGMTALPASVALIGMTGYKGIQRLVRKQNQKTLSELMDSMPQNTINSKGEPGNEKSALHLRSLARAYVDDGASFNDFITENSGAHVSEVLKKAWDDAAKDKELWNKAAATYLQGPRDMAAVHVMGGKNVATALANEGIPVPSIGIVKDLDELADFGDWKFVLNHSAFNPEYDRLRNLVARDDMSSIMRLVGESRSDLRSVTAHQIADKSGPIGGISFDNYFNPQAASAKIHGYASSLDEIRARRAEYSPKKMELGGETYDVTADEAFDLITEEKVGLDQYIQKKFNKDFEGADELLLNITETMANSRSTDIPKNVIKKEILNLGWGKALANDKTIIESVKQIMDMSSNIPIKWQEAKPQKALRFGQGQDISFVIAPKDADPALVKTLQERGVEVTIDDGSGIAQIPDSFKFAMPPVMAALLAEEEETD